MAPTNDGRQEAEQFIQRREYVKLLARAEGAEAERDAMFKLAVAYRTYWAEVKAWEDKDEGRKSPAEVVRDFDRIIALAAPAAEGGTK